MSYETLLVDSKDGVASVTLNRPEVRNALNAALISELEQVLVSLEADPAARVIVLAGAGDRAFCAGADLKGVGDRGTSASAQDHDFSLMASARSNWASASRKTP